MCIRDSPREVGTLQSLGVGMTQEPQPEARVGEETEEARPSEDLVPEVEEIIREMNLVVVEDTESAEEVVEDRSVQEDKELQAEEGQEQEDGDEEQGEKEEFEKAGEKAEEEMKVEEPER